MTAGMINLSVKSLGQDTIQACELLGFVLCLCFRKCWRGII